MNSKENSLLSSKYQQKTEREHILSNPDTYVGSVEKTSNAYWVLQQSTETTNITTTTITTTDLKDSSSDTPKESQQKSCIALETKETVPAALKLLDEALINSRDHSVRMQQLISSQSPGFETAKPVTCIDVIINQAEGSITINNDGSGIDVVLHPETQIYIPQMIFATLRTSTNYNKEEKKIVGGKNGFGIKLVFIWSTSGYIETVDHIRQLKYHQKFDQNLTVIHPPKITKVAATTQPYTKIHAVLDLQRMGFEMGLDDFTYRLFQKRVWDIAAITDRSVKVKLNKKLIQVKTFAQYVDMFLGPKSEHPRIHEQHDSGRWEYVVGMTPLHEFAQVSFVNGICTHKGGKHVEYVLAQITRKLVDLLEKKRKLRVNTTVIKEQLILFLRCDIENPSFDSQTKDFLTTPASKFGSACTVSDAFIEKVAKLGVLDTACAINEVKDQKAAKKTDGTKSRTVRGIPKLMDANWAGTVDKSKNCILIFCEGDSAKAGIVSGLSQEHRNYIGVYPMKGKPMNVRGEAVKRVAENKEIAEIKKILGLESGKVYDSEQTVAKSLRYGRVLFMTDQDLDGSHIKGLIINLFHSEWKSLMSIPGFIGFMNTPILKATKGAKTLVFYNEGEYRQWKNSPAHSSGYAIKYYKGLGTSSGKEFKEYFSPMKVIPFEYGGEESDDMIDMVFNKKKSLHRKEWLKHYERDAFMDTSAQSVSYREFFSKEYIKFSIHDCERSIPHLMDGLKPSQRKILFAAFKKPLINEIKVAQFSGYVSEHSGYHHGEASLNAAIVGMAQNFVGSNNINLLMPNGQMGTRLRGGQDSASERYIFTQLNKLTRILFRVEDDAIMRYLEDDGDTVEPIFYAPIIPMVLVNGCKGIGTGYSTEILSYDPMHLVAYLKTKLLGEMGPMTELHPHYAEFEGSILLMDAATQDAARRYVVKGKYELLGNDKVRVTELPVGVWTADYKEFLEQLLDEGGNMTKDYVDMSTDTKVNFVVTMAKGAIATLETQSVEGNPHLNGLEKYLKLYNIATTSNMHLFDANDVLKRYNVVEEIMEDYFVVRYGIFAQRKENLLKTLQEKRRWTSNKYRYIRETLTDMIDLRGKTKRQMIEMLMERGFESKEEDGGEAGGGSGYHYLVRLPMDSVTEENVTKLSREMEMLESEWHQLQEMSVETMWLNELREFEEVYIKFRQSLSKQGMEEPKTKGMKRKA